jgi:hypothetical protein
MSHNKVKVANQSPDVNSEIDLGLSDLITGTITTGDTVKYDGANWTSSTPSADLLYLYITTSTVDAYSNSGATSTTSGQWNFYGDFIINNIGATVNKYSTTDWVQSITLNAGKYIIRSSTLCEFSASGYLRLQWQDGSNTAISNISMIGDSFTTYGGSSSTCLGYIDIATGTDTIDCIISNSSNVDSVANQGNTPSQYNYILIYKVN